MSVNERSATTAAAPASKGSGLKKIVAASMAGTVVEWYEFFLYATAATLVFSKVFFPATGNRDSTRIIAAFLTYAVGFVARPLGGIVFGHFGDKFGRKNCCSSAIILVGVATFLMGCLPTLRASRLLGAGAAGRPALHPGLRRRRRMGRRRPARRRAQPEQVPRLLGQLAAGRRARRQHAGHRSCCWCCPRRCRDAAFLQLGLAGRVLAVRGDRAGRLLHPHQGHRRADLPRGQAGGGEDQGRLATASSRCPQALPAWRLHRHGPALRARTSCTTSWSPSRSPT